MRLRHIFFILIAGWAGMMYYRYRNVASLFANSYEESKTDDENSHLNPNQSFKSSNNGGGIGKVGGLGPVGSAPHSLVYHH